MTKISLECVQDTLKELGNENYDEIDEVEQIGLCLGSVYNNDELKGSLAEFLYIFIPKYLELHGLN